MRVLNDDLFAVTTATVGTTTGVITELTHMAGFCAQFLLTQTAGSLVGTLQPFGSNDGINFKSTASAQAISGTLSHMDNTSDVYYQFVRYVLILSSGTCSIVAKINAKGF